MKPDSLTPVFVGLRLGLHALFAGLTLLAVLRVLVTGESDAPAVIALAAVFVLTYAVGAALLPRGAANLWLLALTAEWLALVWLTPEAAYLVFPLFFLYLHMLHGPLGPTAVVGSALLAIAAIARHGGFTVGGVVGPLVAAMVAIALGLGYRALYRESAERQRLIDELVAAQEQLAGSEHDKGVLSERTRLAGEIHDTVAQGLSSIQMLLHAAERANPDAPGLEHIRLARETAAANLAEARRFVRELTPPTLAEDSLPGALRRLGSAGSVLAPVTIDGDVRALPMPIETALLRIAQGALANVDKHSGVRVARIELDYRDQGIRLQISDAGAGFDPALLTDDVAEDSFGFAVMRRRMSELGGRLVVDSEPGRGTTVTAVVAGVA